MRWYFPAWNGDHRLEADGAEQSRLIITKPSPWETRALQTFLSRAWKKGWCDESAAQYGGDDEKIALRATVADAGRLLLKTLKPKRETLTAVKFSDGKIETATGSDSKEVMDLAVKAESEGAKAAVSAARPTPSCPDCVPGSVELASEVLLEFLSTDQHRQWAKHRAFDVVGNLSGHRYVLAHRNSPFAIKSTRICFDVEDGAELKFFDWSVPPEEEVLAAKLILESHEDWLRNEATTFGLNNRLKFKNPFGNVGDGTAGATFMRGFGSGLISGMSLTMPAVQAGLVIQGLA